MPASELREAVEKVRRNLQTYGTDLQREIRGIEADGGTAAYERGKSFAYGYAVSLLTAALAAVEKGEQDGE